MDDIKRILTAVDNGDSQAASQLLPLVYEDLKRLAERQMAQETPGHTLSATALVHEAYLRLMGSADSKWDHRGHFYFAAAESMRRILIDRARSKKRLKRGGEMKQLGLDHVTFGIDSPPEQIIALDDALSELESHHPEAAKLVKLRFFGGLGHQEAAATLGMGRRQADRLWAMAKTWLYSRLSSDNGQ